MTSYRKNMMGGDTGRADIKLALDPDRVVRVLFTIVVGLALAHSSMHVWNLIAPEHNTRALYRFFDMGAEANLPTYVSALYLLTASLLLFLITAHERLNGSKMIRHWTILALGVLLMSFDEAAQIHEGIIGVLVHNMLGEGEGMWGTNWYVFYLPLAIIAGIYYTPFLRTIPSHYSRQLILAGVIYGGGAVGMEIVGSYMAANEMGGAMGQRVVEETLEMVGAVILIRALLSYLIDRHISVLLKLYPIKRPGRVGK